MSFVIEVGKKYLHVSGKIITVKYLNRGVYSVTDFTGKDFPVFASELQPIDVTSPIAEVPKPVEVVTPGHQTIMGSIAEAWLNVFVGFSINFGANMLILPLFGFHDLTLGKNFIIGMLYTVISLVRSFVIRRYFNGMKWGNK